MEVEKDTPQVAQFNNLFAPIAITLALLGLTIGASSLDGRDVSGDFLSGAILISLSVLIPACIGRTSWLIPLDSGSLRVVTLTLVTAILGIIANFVDPVDFNHMFLATFVLVGFVSAVLNESNRFEESASFLSVVLGMRLAAYYAGGLMIAQNDSLAAIDTARESLGSAFFSFWLSSISLGLVVMIGLRGSIEQRGKGRLMSVLPTFRENPEVVVYSSLIFASFMVPLIWIGQIDTLQEFSQESHIGVAWGSFSALVIFIHAFFRAEGWHVLGALLAVNWVLYTIGHIHEIGNELPSIFSDDGFIGSFTWFFLWFWMNFFALFFASRGVFGDVAPRRDRSGFRVWWDDNSYVVMVSLAFLIALIVRIAWNVIPAMNANGTGLWDMTGGSDPWYMKRVVDYIIAERSHLIFDHDRAYPSGGINPRPPLFSWSLALGGIALSWVLEIPTDQAVWWSMAALPAIYGALIVLPVAGIASRAHSRRAGMIAAWLIALMPGHMSRSTFAMSDHDSFAMLFLAIAFYFWIRAIEKIDHKKLFKTTSPNPLYIIAGMRETWKRNPSLMANATMSGIAFSIMALGWKGFVYGPGILFLAYSFQVTINIFKGRDSIQFTSAALQMMLVSILVPAPFYAWPGLNLLFAPSGMQPMFYIIGFTFAVGWVSSSFRDKPWLLVVLGGSTLFGSILSLLFILQESGFYNGWDILFTGGFYFSKNKIFGTIGEAQAPERGVLFASYGPVVAIIAIGCAFLLLWRGSRKNKSELTLLGLWTIIASYMAWSAGRFIINATPVMAAVGGIGISMLWGSASLPAFAKVWRNSGIGTPRTRFKSLWPATKARPGVPAMIMVLLLITSQHATYGIDAGIPRGDRSADDIDQSLYDIVPDILRQDLLGLFSVMNSEQYDPSDPESGLWYMGTFGPSFNQQGWNEAYDWLAQQDSDTPFSDRPAFVSWWDYGFQALASGQHPTVADNFQSGIPHSGAMLLSSGQEDTLSLFITTLAMGDRSINGQLGEPFTSVIGEHMSEAQVQEFVAIISNNEKSFLEGRLMAVVAEYGDAELLMGNPLNEDGLTCTGACLDTYIVLVNGEIFGEPTTNVSEAMSLFDEARGSSSAFELSDFDDVSHYDMSGYRYTRDIIDDYDDLSTALHRTNARFGMARAFLITAFSLDDLVQIYDGITSIDSYEVSDYEESHGSTTSRNHEIRYFAVDNRLYPLGGKYYQDYKSYHRGQTTGIFHAPTHLSGLDIDSYITTTYETNQGPKSPEDFQTQYMSDLKAQASGASTGEDMIQMTDMDYQHLDSFFDTMIARTYVGYGTSTLGLPSMSGQVGDADTPSTWILPNSLTGTPGSYLQGAMALPGAMMNHFVLSNWYDPTNGTSCEEIQITGSASTKAGNSQLSNVTLSSSSLSSGWSQIQSGGPWEMTQVENGTIPMGAYTGSYDADDQTFSISSQASSTANVTDFTLTGKADRYCGSIYDSNRNVKILKYFSGATLEGTVSLEGIGPVPNARILIERDAFSGEESADANGNVVDNDSRTYWIPIGSTQADEHGHFSFTVPAGKIRVSAFSGQPDLEAGRTALMTGMGNSMEELFTESSQNRDVNPVTGILGNVYGSTWLSETIVNISGSDGHSNGKSVIEAPISVSPSTASGILSWSGELDFDGEPVLSVQVVLTPSSDEVSIQPYASMTSDGSMDGESLKFTGTGEVTFLGSGKVESMGAVSVHDFTGTHAQAVFDNHSITGEGQFSGKGMVDGSIFGDFPNCSVDSVPNGSEACISEIGSYLIDGTVNGSGKFTSYGVSEFTRVLSQATFIGSGIFVTDSSQNLTTFGTVNGTGMFSGHGTFSGPMVSPGSFHIVDVLPGEYVVSVDFGVGEPVELSQPFVVALESSEYQVPVSISGGAIKGTVSLFSGKPLSNEIAIFSINGSSDDSQDECQGVVTQPCFAIPDESGSFEVGPIVPGSYLAEVDIDDDGFPEVSQIFTFESGQTSLVAFPSEVPQTSDITFTLTDDGTSVDDLQLQFIPEDLSRTPVSAMFDNVTKTYHAELLLGDWILNYTLSDEKQLWQRISIGVVDVNESFEFLVSQVVNGTVVDKPDKEGTISQLSRVSNQEVLFQWEGFTLKSTTDSLGEFSVILPQGAFVQATVERIVGAGGLFSNGTSFEVTDEVGDITIELTDSTVVLGEVSLNREGNTYNQGFSGWQPIFAQANNLDGTTDAVWREEVDDLGRFDMLLPYGNWSFTLDAGDDMGSSSVVKEINSSLDDPTIELLVLTLENSTVQIDFFIDHDGDNNASNGTPVSYPFEIKPLSPNGAGYSVSADGPEWIETGMAEISLEPGRYRIVVERANSSADEPFDTLYDTNEIFDVEIEPSTVKRSVGFEPRWLANITFRNESGQTLNNHEIKLENTESGWVQTFTTNEDGMLVEYINEGDWLVIVEEFETNTGVFEGLRRSLSVSQSSAGSRLNFQTAELATVVVTLQSPSEDEVTLESFDLTISSQEGLGSFVTSVGGLEQSLEIRLVPGLWNVEINQTNQDGVRMFLENTSLVESGVIVGPDHQAYLTVQMLVRLSGKVFWDLDDDDLPGFSEGIANATINITSSDLQSHEIITGQDGSWSTFLPSQSSWNITAEKEGFGTQTSQVDIGETSVNEDIEISAGEVEVSGTITYPDQNCISSGGWQIELIPSHGIVRDRVSVSGNSLGEWSATIQPGSWVAMATTTSDGSTSECIGLVSIESLEVGVEGGSVESKLTEGGTLMLDTSWLDFEGGLHDLTEVEDYDLVLEYDSISWSEELGSDGILTLLILPGTVQTSSSFDIDEGVRNVSYSGGKGVSIRAGQVSPLNTLSIDRVSKQSVITTVLGSDRIEVQEVDISCTSDNDGDGVINGEDAFPNDPTESSDNDGDLIGDNADPDDDNDGYNDWEDDFPLGTGLPTNSVGGCKYQDAEFTISIEYEGHNSFDEYTVVGTIPGADGTDWKVQFQNSTGEWLETATFDMGLTNSDITEDLSIRVVPANVGTAHHFSEGHRVLVKISTSQGYSTQLELRVDIPENNGMEIYEPENLFFNMEETIVTIEIPFKNTGNSDEFFYFQFDSSEWWEFAGPTTQPASPFSDGTATFTLVRSAETALPSPYAEEIKFTVSDQDNNTYSGSTVIETDSPVLSIVGDSAILIGGSGGFASFGEIEQYSVNISNIGNVDAEGVTLSATLCYDITCNNVVGVNSTSSGSVSAMSESTFYITVDYTQFTEAKTYWLVFSIDGELLDETSESCTSPKSEGKASCVLEAQLWSSSVENDNLKYLAYAFLIMLITALLYFTRRPGRRVSAPF